MKFKLGRPEHGWVAVKVELAGTCLEFLASEVPNDPIEGLVDAIRTTAGREASLWWHLEPDGWIFEFSPTPQGVRLQALYAEQSNRIEPMRSFAVNLTRPWKRCYCRCGGASAVRNLPARSAP